MESVAPLIPSPVPPLPLCLPFGKGIVEKWEPSVRGFWVAPCLIVHNEHKGDFVGNLEKEDREGGGGLKFCLGVRGSGFDMLSPSYNQDRKGMVRRV